MSSRASVVLKLKSAYPMCPTNELSKEILTSVIGDSTKAGVAIISAVELSE